MKNCDQGLQNAALGRRLRAAFSRPRSQFFTIVFTIVDLYSRHTSCLANAVDYDKLNVLKNNIFISTMLRTFVSYKNCFKVAFSLFSTFVNSRKKTHASIILTVVRERKIQPALRTFQIAGFVTMPTWK